MAWLQYFLRGLAVLIPSLISLDCIEVGSLSGFIPLAIGISWRPLGTPGSFNVILTLTLGAILSTTEGSLDVWLGCQGSRMLGSLLVHSAACRCGLCLPSGQKPGTLTSYSPLGHSARRVPSWLNPPTASRLLSQRQLGMEER